MKNREIIIYNSENEDSDMEWTDFKCYFEEMLIKNNYIMTGYFGSWRGKLAGGKFIHNIQDLISIVQHLEYMQIKDINGHLFITGCHHDGSDSYEIKRLTNKGYELASKYCFAKDRQLHNSIMNCNFYSALPRYAEKVYCV